jgi:exopolysaccharide/PEP-CTERM locus tyrosine autokinase
LSFIDKALERAKALRPKPEKGMPPRPQATPPLKEPQEPSPKTWGESVPADSICYSATKTVPVDHEVLKRHRLIAWETGGPIVEEYKLVRIHILQRTKAESRNTLMVTGALPDEGKTLTAINLAISMSQELDQTVLLVDADLRSPSVHQYFGLPQGLGLVDYLKYGTPIPELLVHPRGLAKLVLLLGGQPVTEAAELINSQQMAELVHELKHCYQDRYVLFDLPPILSYADGLAFSRLVDGIVLVVEAGRTPREKISQCLELLKDLPVLGLILNKADNLPSEHYLREYQKAEPPILKKKRKFPWFR